VGLGVSNNGNVSAGLLELGLGVGGEVVVAELEGRLGGVVSVDLLVEFSEDIHSQVEFLDSAERVAVESNVFHELGGEHLLVCFCFIL